MRYIPLTTLIISLFALNVTASDGYYSKGVKYDSYFITSTTSFVPYHTLIVTFYETKPTMEQANQLLVKLTEATATLYSDKNIMVRAVFMKDSNSSEIPIEVKKGIRTIIWNAKTKKIEYKDY